MIARRTLLLAIPILLVAGCAGSQRSARLREQLDRYSVPKRLAEVWPEALRYVHERGFALVGKDRRLLGLPDQDVIGKFFSKGHDTRAASERQWVAETGPNHEQRRYRVEGTETGPASCRIEFFSIQGNDLAEPEREYRDVQLELDFIERYDADTVEKMTEAARRGK